MDLYSGIVYNDRIPNGLKTLPESLKLEKDSKWDIFGSFLEASWVNYSVDN